MTCPRCTIELPPRATYCSTCGACLERVVPPELPIPEVEVLLSESETRERAEHEDAVGRVVGERCAGQMLLWMSVESDASRKAAIDAIRSIRDRRAILDGMRRVLSDPDGCGSRYCHAAACRAVDAVEGQRG